MTFSAYELGERALAWIVEERELRAALVRGVRDAGVDVLAPAAFARLAFAPDAAHARARRRARRSRRSSSSARTAFARGSGRPPASSPRRGRTGRPASWRISPASAPHRGCARQWFRADGGVLAWLPLPERRISIVWSAPVRARGRADGARRRERSPIASRPRAAHALGALELDHAAGSVPAVATCGCPRPSPIASRWSATPRTACIRWPARASISASATRRRSRRSSPSAVRSTTPGAPMLLERYARRRAEPVLAVQAVTDGLARLFGARAPWLATVAQRSGWRPSTACRSPSICSRSPRCADCPIRLFPETMT